VESWVDQELKSWNVRICDVKVMIWCIIKMLFVIYVGIFSEDQKS
jgi:hypothetical protein